MMEPMRLPLTLLFLILSSAHSLGQVKNISRTWTSADNDFQTEAKLIEHDKEKVVLQKSNGITITVPLKKLSKVDRKYLDQLKEESESVWVRSPNAVEKEGYILTRLEVDASNIIEELQWSSDGRYLFTLDSKGILRKFAIPSCEEVDHVDLSGVGSWLSRSSLGLVAVLNSTQEICVIDERTLKVTRRHKLPGVNRATSSPKLSVAFATDGGGSALLAVDLRSGKVKATQGKAPFHNAPRSPQIKFHPSSLGLHSFKHAYPLPDGKTVFCVGTECIYKFRLTRSGFMLEEVGPRLGSNPRRLELSHDGKMIAMPSGGGNYQIENHPEVNYGTYIYSTGNLHTPLYAIATGHYPRTLAFDLKANKIYSQNYDNQLVVMGKNGVKLSEFKIEQEKDSTRHLLAHPLGNKLCLLTGKNLYWIELNSE